MATVSVRPLLDWERKLNRFRPSHPPIFSDGEPTQHDVELARELFLALDPESQRWYGTSALFVDLVPGDAQ